MTGLLKHAFTLGCTLLLAAISQAQPQLAPYPHDLGYFLPKTLPINAEQTTLSGNYNPNIPTPKAVFGYELGEQYCDWGEILCYLEKLDAASERIRLVEIGRSYENRPFVQLLITSPKNHTNLDQIKAEHRKLIDPKQSAALEIGSMPLVVDIAASIHGDEPSGVHAAVAMAYFFAASEDAAVLELLDKIVLSLVPGANPDGIDRFASWLNSTASPIKTLDPASREYNQPWPSCRHNHYLADPNRDLLMCQHPEGRLAVSRYLDWMPNLVIDLHEKRGKNGAFFHSPGHPQRLHNYVTTENQELTAEVGAYVARELDALGAKPYSGCEFDDFYLGKGAAYGDVQGSVCLLFEQPKLHNYTYQYEDRILTFPQSIRNQFFGCLGALGAGYDMREKLLEYQRDFYKKSAVAAEQNAVQGYLFHADGDRARAYRLIENLAVHQIEVYHLAQDMQVGDQHFAAADSFLIPLREQPYFYKTMAVWETIGLDTYEDNIFYDISTWTFPLAYQVAHAEVQSTEGLIGARAELNFPKGTIVGGQSHTAYLIGADALYAKNVLRTLLQHGATVKVAQQSFSADGRTWGCGTAVVEVKHQPLAADRLFALLDEAAREHGVTVYAVSDSFESHTLALADVRLPKVALLTGQGMNEAATGELWFLLEQHFGIAPSRLDLATLGTASLARYDVILAANGTLPEGDKGLENLRQWVRNGGTLITTQTAYELANRAGLTRIKPLPLPSNESLGDKVPGAILNAVIDPTSPLGYGYSDTRLPMMKMANIGYKEPSTRNALVPLRYTAEPLLSGYLPQEKLDRFASTPAALVVRCDRGRVIHFADSPTFRSYWHGATRMVMNAIYFGHLYE